MTSEKTVKRPPRRTSVPASSDRPEDAWLPAGKLITFGLQHVLTMYGGIIAVPLVMANALGLSAGRTAIMVTASLFVGGLATILQSVGVPFLGAKLPVVQGVTFGGVATMLAILATPGSNITTVLGAVIVASIVGFLIAPFFASVVRFLPPVVTGTVIAGIGLSLIPVASDWSMGGDAKASDYGSMANVLLAFMTLAITLVFSKVGSAALSRLSILLGLVAGTIAGLFMGLTDFSGVGEGAWAAPPEIFGFGWPTFDPAAIISMVIVILVAMTESVANLLAVGEVVGTRVGRRRIARGLRADMLSSAAAPVFGSFTQTAFSQNIGLIALTGVKSRFVVATGGVILVVMGLLPVLGQVVAAIPMPVLGGAGIVLFGTVAGSGIRTLKGVSYEGNMNLIIVSVSLAFGMIPMVQPDIYQDFPSWFQTIFSSGISSAAIMAVLLNLIFNEIHLGNSKGASVFAARPVRYLTSSDLEKLQEGDVVTDGKLVDRDGEEVPCVPDSRTTEVQEAIASGEVTDTSQIRMILDGDKPIARKAPQD
ncbi:nucleobase:cation symporter-2 family protein [Rothia uropygioeca]|uniref:nucleobase:cation symporter-2 family protein n=1 Tax=Kocuria sp. 257 TaxID=2021970 RepID=UPI0010118E55|nr:nucleobase:cation symporter-2 family protein [Kocuria sp. 257]